MNTVFYTSFYQNLCQNEDQVIVDNISDKITTKYLRMFICIHK